MKKICLLSAVAVAAVASASAALAANVVVDGDFNNTNAAFQTIFSGSTFNAWTVTNGSIDLIGGYWQSPSGANAATGGTNGSVDLDGDNPGGISQLIGGLTSGNTYTLTFALSGNPDGGPSTKSVDVSIGSVANDNFTYTTTSNTHTNMQYIIESVSFTANASNTLSLVSQDASSSPYGPVVGDVSIVAGSSIPEASTWAMMFAGFAALGFLGLRGRRAAAFPD